MSKCKLTIENVRKLRSNEGMKELVAKLILERSVLKTISPEIEGIYNETLKQFNFTDKKTGEKIVDYNRLYKSKENATEFYKKVQRNLDEKGWLKNMKSKDHCPKLVQEMKVFNIEKKIIEQVQDIFGFPEIYKREHIEEILDLTIRLIVNDI